MTKILEYVFHMSCHTCKYLICSRVICKRRIIQKGTVSCLNGLLWIGGNVEREEQRAKQ